MLRTVAPRVAGRSGGGAVAAAAPRLSLARGVAPYSTFRSAHVLPAAAVAAHSAFASGAFGSQALLSHR